MRMFMSFVPGTVWRLVAALVLTGYVSSAAGVDTKGVIAGRVVDSSGAILHGAQVQLQSKGLAVASDERGEFSLADLAPGSYKIQVSYVGFKPFETDVTVAAGELKRVDVAFGSRFAGRAGPRDGRTAARRSRSPSTAPAWPTTFSRYCRRKSSPHCPTPTWPTLSAGSLPSPLERIEGEGVYVHGARHRSRASPTSPSMASPFLRPNPPCARCGSTCIPADLVESVEINKTLAPNMDGDGIGGSVNMKTKTAGEFPTINLFGLGGYNPILGGRLE